MHYVVEYNEPILVETLLEKNSDCNMMDNNGNLAWDFDNWHREETYKVLACIVYEKAKEQLRSPQPRERGWMDTVRITKDRNDVKVKEHLAAFAKELEESKELEQLKESEESVESEDVDEVEELETVEDFGKMGKSEEPEVVVEA